MPVEVRRAYQSFADQRTRCNNPANPNYALYGGKGVRVKYSGREFVGWWLEEIRRFSGSRPTCGRIDHAGDYEFGNIEIQDHIDNCYRDTTKRRDLHQLLREKCSKPVVIYRYPSMEFVANVSSGVEAAKRTGAKRTNISKILLHSVDPSRKRVLSAKGFTFRYESEKI